MLKKPLARPTANVEFRSNFRKSQQGFTFIEVIIAVSIVMILAAVAIPRYDNYLTESRRADGHHLLLANSVRLQRCLTLAGTYSDNCPLQTESAEGYYKLREKLDTQAWILEAIPTDKGGQDDDEACSGLMLTHTGRKSATGNEPEECW